MLDRRVAPSVAALSLLIVLGARVPDAKALGIVTTSHESIDVLIAKHAKANGIPADIVHATVKRESGYNPLAIGRGGAMGLMQIKTGTARALGYAGPPSGLLDANTNLTWGVRYLAGAYRTARGDEAMAHGYYRRGYYYAAKKLGLTNEMMIAEANDAPEVATAPTFAQSPLGQLLSRTFGGRPAAGVATASADPGAALPAGALGYASSPSAAGPVAGTAGAPSPQPVPPAGSTPTAAPIARAAAEPASAQTSARTPAPAPAQIAEAGVDAESDVRVPLPPRRPREFRFAALRTPSRAQKLRPSAPAVEEASVDEAAVAAAAPEGAPAAQ